MKIAKQNGLEVKEMIHCTPEEALREWDLL